MRTILYNLLAFIVISFLIFGAVTLGLNKYTRHGTSITVADFKGMTVDQLDEYIKNKPLNYRVVDSTFVSDKLPGTILEQNPVEGKRVKQDRRVYLTINASVPPKIQMPDLISSSLKNAKIQLENNGLVLGKTIFKPCLGKNTVSETVMDDKPLKKGQEIFKGSKIDLILCDGIGNKPIEVPDLVGLSYVEAISVLRLSELSVGAIMKDEGVYNLEASYIRRQTPQSDSYNMIKIGEPIDLYLQKEKVVLDEMIESDFNYEMPATQPAQKKIIDFNNPASFPDEIKKVDSTNMNSAEKRIIDSMKAVIDQKFDKDGWKQEEKEEEDDSNDLDY